jgi:hypothetical protein
MTAWILRHKGRGSMLPIQEALNRVVAILDLPDFHLKRQQIEEHLDTVIEYARDSNELGQAVEFKVLALNHVDSVGRDYPADVEANRVAALKALEQLQCAIISRSADWKRASARQREEITMAEKNEPSLAEILKAIPKMSDDDVVKLREAVMAECGKRGLPVSSFTEDHSIPQPRRPRWDYIHRGMRGAGVRVISPPGNLLELDRRRSWAYKKGICLSLVRYVVRQEIIYSLSPIYDLWKVRVELYWRFGGQEFFDVAVGRQNNWSTDSLAATHLISAAYPPETETNHPG